MGGAVTVAAAVPLNGALADKQRRPPAKAPDSHEQAGAE